MQAEEPEKRLICIGVMMLNGGENKESSIALKQSIQRVLDFVVSGGAVIVVNTKAA